MATRLTAPKSTTTRNKKNSKKTLPKVSLLQRPDGISLEDWQIALRKQAAQKELLTIAPVDKKLSPGDFYVRNPQTDHIYKVAFRGTDSEWNYCSCPDFKTNQLGTCKHIEAVQLHLGKQRKRPAKELIPPYTSVYLSYRAERDVRIRIGSDNREAFTALAGRYFTEEGVLEESNYARFYDFLQEARQIDDTFRCYDDALDFIIEKRAALYRNQVLDNKYPDNKLPGLLRTRLYPYQEEGILFAARKGRCIIADEMGLGKTIQAIGAAELLRKEFNLSSVLILCPTSLKYQWKKEIEKFTGETALVIEGNHLKRREQYNRDACYKIVSYQSANNDIKILKTLSADLLIMDEAQRLKNWNTQIAKAAKRIESQYTVVLSGTPLENKIEELYAIAQYVNPYCLGPYYKFIDRCLVRSETGKTVGYKNLNETGRMIRNILVRRRKRDVNIQLPARMDKILFVPMTAEQREMHDEFKSSLAQLIMKWQKMRFLSESDRRRLLLLMNQMRMVCDSTYILDQKSRFDTKIDELMNVLDEFFEESDEKTVIFSQWERMTRLVAAELDKRGVAYEYLNGSVPSAKRKDLIDNFTEKPDCRVFLSTDAGSTGLNLQAASLIINLDLPWNPAVLEQRIARIHRMGQKNNVQVINFVSVGTIEEQMLTKLNFKSSMFEGILDDGSDSIFLEESKFDKLMQTVQEFAATGIDADTDENLTYGINADELEKPVSEEERSGKEETILSETMIPDVEPEEEQKISAISSDAREMLPGRPSDAGTGGKSPGRFAGDDAEEAPSLTPVKTTGAVDISNTNSPEQLVSQGINLLGAFARTLSSPEATQKLVDSLIETDKETGKTSLKIPVPDRDTVVQVMSVLGKLFK
ncbi:Helicase conserved C-terminal domain-containing protein [Porphyromonadaceae bacterium KH3R12]|nr:Helicase conserved C-terminal domain-containing protein [Porphyromonadaceae bacterium KH3R12]